MFIRQLCIFVMRVKAPLMRYVVRDPSHIANDLPNSYSQVYAALEMYSQDPKS